MHFFHLLAVVNAALKLDFTAYEHQDDNTLRVRDWSRGFEITPNAHKYSTVNGGNRISHMVDIEVGSNRDKLTVQLDTLSNELAIFMKGGFCHNWSKDRKYQDKHRSAACQVRYGAYDPSKSTTSSEEGYDQDMALVRWGFDDFSEFKGSHAVDDVTLGAVTVKNQRFFLTKSTNSHWGFLGLGYQNESELYDPVEEACFLSSLKYQGHISKKLYSLYYANESASSGSVLFGGVDTAKISSGLTTIPLLFTEDYSEQPAMRVDSVSLGNATLFADKYYCQLSLGKTGIYLPRPLYNQLWANLDIVTVGDVKTLNCPSEDAMLVFDFGGSRVSIPLTHLVSPALGPGFLCVLRGVFVGSDDGIVLGDAFLRYAYTVVDYDAMEVSIGPVKFTSDSNVVDVKDEVPMATRAALWKPNISNVSTVDWESYSYVGYPTGDLNTDYWPFSFNWHGDGAAVGATVYTWLLMVLAMI
ncbi:hypothetical protein DICA3_E27666 [Diutina catenulata]